MTVVLGFGTAEQRAEADVESQIRREVAGRSHLHGDYFSMEFAREIDKLVRNVALQSRSLADAYKDAETHPDRYSYFFATTLNDASHLVFILKFQHVNRRHPSSPDGWAVMETERIFYIRHGE